MPLRRLQLYNLESNIRTQYKTNIKLSTTLLSFTYSTQAARRSERNMVNLAHKTILRGDSELVCSSGCTLSAFPRNQALFSI